MEDRTFDNLARGLAGGITRRGAVKGVVTAFLATLGRSSASSSVAQVTQVYCGNVICANDPGRCPTGCVCCVYPNGNSRCRPPGTCGPGEEVVPTTTSTTTSTTAPPITTTTTPTTTTTQTTTASPQGPCAGKSDGEPCDSGNLCRTGETCQSGVCTGGTDVSCTPESPCMVALCDPSRGCFSVPAPIFTPCDDGNACTTNARCDAAGRCLGELAVDCGPCQRCDPASGTCIADAQDDGVDCTPDGNTCFARFTCQSGVCVGEDRVECEPSSACVDATCDEASGLCIETANPGANLRACTPPEDRCKIGTCLNGECTDLRPNSCRIEACELCDPATGECTEAPDETVCFRSCGQVGLCRSGTCLIEGLADGCVNIFECDDFVCDDATGQCVRSGEKDGQPCGGSLCNQCLGGQCVPAVTCSEACQTCNPETGQCETCEPCCGGQCGLFDCRGACCPVGTTACAGNRWGCCPIDRFCEHNGQCLRPGDICCGPDNGPTFCYAGETCCTHTCCPPGHSCCPTALTEESACCPGPCGVFGCIS